MNDLAREVFFGSPGTVPIRKFRKSIADRPSVHIIPA